MNQCYYYVRDMAEQSKKHISKNSILNGELAIKRTQSGHWPTHEELQYFFHYCLIKMNKVMITCGDFKKSQDLSSKRKIALSFQRTLLTITHFLIGGLRKQVVAKMETKYVRQNKV